MPIQQMLLGAGAAGEKYWLNSWYYDAASYSLDWRYIDVDDDGNIYTFGPGWATSTFGWFAKWNKNGEKVYMRKINAKQDNNVAHGMVVSGTKAYLAGHQGGSSTYPGAPMMALNLSDGTIAWQKRYTTDDTNENRNHTKAVAADSSGNAYWVTKRLSYTDDFIVYKTNSSGVLQWAARITRPSSSQYIDQMNSIKLDSSGNVYVGGIRNDTGTYDWSGFLIKLNSSGVLQWTKELGDSGDYSQQKFHDIAVDSSSNVYCVGTDRSESNASHRGWIVKYNSSGTLQWQKEYGGQSGQSVNQYQWNCAFHDGYLYTGGENDLTGSNSHLIKIDPSDGSIEWQRYIKAWPAGTSYYWWKKCKMRIANDSIYIPGLQQFSSRYAGIIVKLPLTALDDDIGSGDETWEVGTWTHPMNDTSYTDSSPSFTGTLLSSGSCDDGTGEDWEVTSTSDTTFVQHELHEIDA